MTRDRSTLLGEAHGRARALRGSGVLIALAVASCGYPNFTFGTGGEAGSEATSSGHGSTGHGATTGASSSSSSSSSSGFTCADVHGAEGCCDDNGDNEYCLNGTDVIVNPCSPLDCGWEAGGGYYGCGGFSSDPSGKNPMTCGK